MKNKHAYPEEYAYILDLFESFPKKSFNHKQIAFQLPIDHKCSSSDIEKILSLLIKEDKIEQIKPGKYRYIPHFKLISGRIDFTQRGAAYVISDDLDDDIFISPSLTGAAINGDTVTVELLHQRKGANPEGRVVQVLQRANSSFVGTVEKLKGAAFVVCDNPKIHVDFFVVKKNLLGAKDGEKVLVELIDWPKGDKNPTARVTKVLGKSGENETEMNAIVAEFGFPLHFNAKTEKEAAAFPDKIPAAELKKRRDFRDILTFTIDPEDAKDFDDALSFRKLGEGRYEIGIHIADVSYYVQPGTALDDEAYERGTSVYLVDRVIPMLPERLSNGLCSLRPGEDSLTYAVVIEMDDNAKILKQWIGRTVIHSHRRFSYEEAQQRLETGKGDLAAELQLLNKLAGILRTEKFKNGAISFESDEVKFKLDEDGKPLYVFKKERKDAHKLIEDFMLLANKLVAKYAAVEVKNGYLPYRVHEAPSMEKLGLLQQIAGRFGYTINTTSQLELARSLNNMTAKAANTPQATLLNPLAIRSMEKAIYTTKKTSHFGLAFEYYCHFTSPIRRYPDLITHRLLTGFLEKSSIPDKDTVEKIAKQSSAMEQKAVEAERASIKYKQTQYLEEHVGDEFEGTVTGLTEWGIYVELNENKCEGMVRISEIKGDLYEFYDKLYAVIGRRKRHRIDLGQTVTVKVKRTNLQKRTIDFLMIDF